jgi:hypothetical protein
LRFARIRRSEEQSNAYFKAGSDIYSSGRIGLLFPNAICTEIRSLSRR